MGMKSRQGKALELRDLITKVNAISAELREDGCSVSFKCTLGGRIKDLLIEKIIKL